MISVIMEGEAVWFSFFNLEPLACFCFRCREGCAGRLAPSLSHRTRIGSCGGQSGGDLRGVGFPGEDGF